MSAKPNSGNTGYEAYKLGREHADSIFRQSGLGTLRKLAWVKPRTDYERGKIGRACEILAKAYEVEAPAEQLQVPKSPTPG